VRRLQSWWNNCADGSIAVTSIVPLQKAQVESMRDASIANLAISYLDLVYRMCEGKHVRAKKMDADQKKENAMPRSMILQNKRETMILIFQSLTAAVRSQVSTCSNKAVAVLLTLLPQILQLRDFETYLGGDVFKSAMFALIWRSKNGSGAQWELIKLLSDIYVAFVIDAQRCELPRLLLVKMCGHEGGTKVGNFERKLRCLKSRVRKQRHLLKEFVGDTEEAARMRKSAQGVVLAEESILLRPIRKVENIREELNIANERKR